MFLFRHWPKYFCSIEEITQKLPTKDYISEKQRAGSWKYLEKQVLFVERGNSQIFCPLCFQKRIKLFRAFQIPNLCCNYRKHFPRSSQEQSAVFTSKPKQPVWKPLQVHITSAKPLSQNFCWVVVLSASNSSTSAMTKSLFQRIPWDSPGVEI